MQRVHFKPKDTAEAFGFAVSEKFFCESQRSKSKEHTDRFLSSENFQKTEKTKEIKS